MRFNSRRNTLVRLVTILNLGALDVHVAKCGRRWNGNRTLVPYSFTCTRTSAETCQGLCTTVCSKVYSNSLGRQVECKRFCNMFSGSSPSLLRQHGSCSSALLPVELSENMLQNLFLNLPPQTVPSSLRTYPHNLYRSKMCSSKITVVQSKFRYSYTIVPLPRHLV